VLATQAPLASQRELVSVAAVQTGLAQDLPAVAAKLQAPLPSQLPVQVPLPTHSLAGSSPAETGTQVPALPARLQATQVPSQAPSQQTPSAQNPDSHSAAALQLAPRGLRELSGVGATP
jgi:hypothetical protein